MWEKGEEREGRRRGGDIDIHVGMEGNEGGGGESGSCFWRKQAPLQSVFLPLALGMLHSALHAPLVLSRDQNSLVIFLFLKPK